MRNVFTNESKQIIMNSGKILLRYLGDSSSNKNLPKLDFIIDAKIGYHDTFDTCIFFKMDYPNCPYNGEIIFNLITTRSINEKLFIYTYNVIKLELNEFIVTANYFYLTDGNTENFEIIGRFKGEVPSDLCHSVCPSLSEMVS